MGVHFAGRWKPDGEEIKTRYEAVYMHSLNKLNKRYPSVLLHKGEERKRKNKNLNQHKWYCPECHLAICTKPIHCVVVLADNCQYCKICAENM